MGSRHEAQAVIAKSSASQNGNLECPEPQEKKGNIQVWESRKNCHPRNHRACHGHIQWHKCLQVFVERNAGRFIRGGSEKLCPKLSMALTGCFHLPMVPDSLFFFFYYSSRDSKKNLSPDSNPCQGSSHLSFQTTSECLCEACSDQRWAKQSILVRNHLPRF